jgi:hypothetical protein
MDLPLCGRQVRLSVIAQRFRCGAVPCGQQIFTERFAGDVLAPSAKRRSNIACGYTKSYNLHLSLSDKVRLLYLTLPPVFQEVSSCRIESWIS